jgi:hypothetical protein
MKSPLVRHLVPFMGVLTCLCGLVARADEIAHSISEFSQTQGNEGWYQGYRNYTADGRGDNYNAGSDFIPFPAETWNGTGFDLNPNASGPWTESYAENSHPNGTNSAPGSEQWVIRRWQADEVSTVTPLAVSYSLRKTNTACGAAAGTTASLHQNGVRVDFGAVPGDDGVGITRTYYLNVLPGDKIDLALTPVNEAGGRGDGCDGSAFSMVIDTTIPPNPMQPDGSPFVPASAADTDADGLPDFWEVTFFPGDLTQLSAAGDKDADGLNDAGEYARLSSPVDPDTDDDGLGDQVETKTGVYVNSTNTGSSPTSPDSDGDGLSDAAEVNAVPPTNPNLVDTDGDTFSDPSEKFFGSDPTLAADTPLSFVVANSVAEFSGVQGQGGWSHGYRDFTATGRTMNYDPSTAFIPFAGGSSEGTPYEGGIGGSQHWDGAKWDLAVPADPWTEVGAEGLHPNGTNGVAEHWVVRRWQANELAAPTAVALTWHMRKGNPNDNGVTGILFVNGRQFDHRTIAGNDSVGVTRKVYTVLKPADIVDLVLTPTGTSQGFDYSDGSANWLRVDTRIPAGATQPDGVPFFPPGSPDTDGDGLADAWEQHYKSGPLSGLSGGAEDADSDGLSNAKEQDLGTDPTRADTDADGLNDGVETMTGVVLGPSDTGSNPRRADSDEDGLSDRAEALGPQFFTSPMLADTDGDIFNDRTELTAPSDPTLAASTPNTPLLANSVAEFSGTQETNSWQYGWRDLTADGGASDYDPESSFIAFVGGDGLGDWNGADQQWDGGGWRLSGASPWTSIFSNSTHPNNGGPGEHWSLRRWISETTEPTALALRWFTGKGNTGCGDGVTGALYLNGLRLDEVTIAFNDGTGVVRVYYAMLEPGDVVDLVVQPDGLNGSKTDGCDGTVSWLRIDDQVPANARQPDGSPFMAEGPAFAITGVTRDPGTGRVTLTWPSTVGQTFDVYSSRSLATGQWSLLSPAAGVPSAGDSTSFTDTTVAPDPSSKAVFYRVSRR